MKLNHKILREICFDESLGNLFESTKDGHFEYFNLDWVQSAKEFIPPHSTVVA